MRIYLPLLLILFFACAQERTVENKDAGSDSTATDSTTARQALVEPASIALSSEKKLFPVYGITLGTTTMDEIKSMGFKCRSEDGLNRCFVNMLWFSDNTGDGVADEVYVVEGSGLPDAWQETFQFSFDHSYDKWLGLLNEHGFGKNITKEPDVVLYQDRKTLTAQMIASTDLEYLNIMLTFDYGNEDGDGYETTSPRSLYSITIYPYDPSSFDGDGEYETEEEDSGESVDDVQEQDSTGTDPLNISPSASAKRMSDQPLNDSLKLTRFRTEAW
jgi:hypothetical protein